MANTTTKKSAGRPAQKKNTETTTPISVEKTIDTKVEEVVKEKVVTTSKVIKPQRQTLNMSIDMNALIPCKSVVYGELTYISRRTNIPYTWANYGSIEMLRYEELITMRSANPKFLTKPWIIIEDQEVVESLRLEDIYDNLFDLDDVDKFLSKPFEEIKALFLSAPEGLKQTFVSKITQMVHNKTINDIRIVTMIDECMGTGLKEFL